MELCTWSLWGKIFADSQPATDEAKRHAAAVNHQTLTKLKALINKSFELQPKTLMGLNLLKGYGSNPQEHGNAFRAHR